MARRAFLPTIPPPPGTPSPGGLGAGHSGTRAGLGSSASADAPPRSVPPPSGHAPRAAHSGNEGGRLSSPPSGMGAGLADGISMAACAQLLDRRAAADEAPFIVAWVESVLSGRTRVDSTLAVRLLRAYRETGRVDRARELAASLPSAPSSWNPLDTARLAIEPAILATIDGRAD